MTTLTLRAFNPPAIVTGLPRINSGQYPTDTLTLDLTGLTGIETTTWRFMGGATIGTELEQSPMGYAGSLIECAVACDQGVLVTPAVMIYMPMMSASHNADDVAVLNLAPHHEATHIAIADGNWTSPATWFGGTVPRNGANVLIPAGREVIYDQHKSFRLNWIRVDGTLKTSLTKSTYCLVDTHITTRGGRFECGTPEERLPSQYTAEWVISNRICRASVNTPSNLDLDSDPKLIGRGILSQGARVMAGSFKTSWLKTANGSAPMAGATSATLAFVPTGWVVGDEIVIGGTGYSTTVETETRTISAIDGAVVSWVDGLLYDHDHRNPSVNRTDLQPGIANMTRNVKIRSENSEVPAYQRGHTMDMHMMCHLKLDNVEHVSLGRTIKGDATPSGKIDENGDFKTSGVTSGAFNTVEMTADANVQSRYSIHIHKAGQDKAETDSVVGCTVRDGKGWGITHHDSRALINFNVTAYIDGAGIVSETGNETGEWIGNFSTGMRNRDNDTPKNAENPMGLNGDFFRRGYCFASTSRAVINYLNFAQDGSYGHVWYHRAAGLTPPIDHNVSDLFLKDLRTFRNDGTMAISDHPLIGANFNESAGMYGGGLFITKSGPEQGHGFMTNIHGFTSWAFNMHGAEIEYIAQYGVTDWDIIAPATGLRVGLVIGNNTAHVSVVRPKTEQCLTGIQINGGAGITQGGEFNLTTEPRYVVVAHSSKSDGEKINYGNDGNLVTVVYATEPTYIEPSHTLPFKLGEWDGSAAPDAGITAAATGLLTDTVSSGGALPSPVDDLGLLTNSPNSDNDALDCRTYVQTNGYWNVSGVPYIIFPFYAHDRITGDWIKTWHGIEITGGAESAYNLEGTYTLSANAPAVSPASLSVAQNGSDTIDVLALASDVDGGTLTLSDSYLPPKHGRLSISGGVVTYAPFEGFTGSDKAQLAVEDGQGHSTRVDLQLMVA